MKITWIFSCVDEVSVVIHLKNSRKNSKMGKLIIALIGTILIVQLVIVHGGGNGGGGGQGKCF